MNGCLSTVNYIVIRSERQFNTWTVVDYVLTWLYIGQLNRSHLRIKTMTLCETFK